MKFHPASELFPLLEGEEFEKFKMDIQKNGCLEPIIILDGQILDGRNRWRACQDLGIKPNIKEWNSDTNPIEFVLSMNLHRRHLTPSQRADIAAKALPAFRQEMKKRQSEGGKLRAKMPQVETTRAREKVAEFVGVSPRYVQDAKKIQKKRPDLSREIMAGRMTIPEAKREMEKTEVEKVEKWEKKTRKEINKDICSEEFKEAFVNFTLEIKKAKESRWRTTSKFVARHMLEILISIVTRKEVNPIGVGSEPKT
jgi:ParB-like chromosome segregation protein Spo0J